MKIPTSHDFGAGEIIPGEIRGLSDIRKGRLITLNNLDCASHAAASPSVDLLAMLPQRKKHILQHCKGRNIIRLRRESTVYIPAQSGSLSSRSSEDHDGFSGRSFEVSLVPETLHIDIATRIQDTSSIARGCAFNHANALDRNLLVNGADSVPRFVNGFYRWQWSSLGDI